MTRAVWWFFVVQVVGSVLVLMQSEASLLKSWHERTPKYATQFKAIVALMLIFELWVLFRWPA